MSCYAYNKKNPVKYIVICVIKKHSDGEEEEGGWERKGERGRGR